LTTPQVTVLADGRGIDIPSGLERIFNIVELLEDDSLQDDEAVLPLAEAGFLESVALPNQYNITHIDVLIRDPLWVFAFWEIKGSDKETQEGASDFGGYCLRVSPADGEGRSSGESSAEAYSFTVPVGIDDTSWYLGFPRGSGSRRQTGPLRVELCALQGEETLSLAVSKPFILPSLFPAAGESCAEQTSGPGPEVPRRTPLVLLSGLDDLPVLRNADCLSRTRQACGLTE
jgi:hypothetical protein